MSSEYPEVRALVNAMVLKVPDSLGNPSAQAVGMAMYGMKGMKSDHVEVCQPS